MKVNGNLDSGALDKLTKARTTKGTSEAEEVKGSSTSNGSTKVSISEVARISEADVPFDAAKVEAIRAAIANGTFTVDIEAVADGMIATEALSAK